MADVGGHAARHSPSPRGAKSSSLAAAGTLLLLLPPPLDSLDWDQLCAMDDHIDAAAVWLPADVSSADEPCRGPPMPQTQPPSKDDSLVQSLTSLSSVDLERLLEDATKDFGTDLPESTDDSIEDAGMDDDVGLSTSKLFAETLVASPARAARLGAWNDERFATGDEDVSTLHACLVAAMPEGVDERSDLYDKLPPYITDIRGRDEGNGTKRSLAARRAEEGGPFRNASGTNEERSGRRSVRPPHRETKRAGDCHVTTVDDRRHGKMELPTRNPWRRWIGRGRPIEDRRIIYVGNISEQTTKAELRQRFNVFGPVEDVSLHFRERGDNYGFVTFCNKADAFEAVEHGNADPDLPKYELCFGGRRHFCRMEYSDLDSDYGKRNHKARQNKSTYEFDALLEAAKTKFTDR